MATPFSPTVISRDKSTGCKWDKDDLLSSSKLSIVLSLVYLENINGLESVAIVAHYDLSVNKRNNWWIFARWGGVVVVVLLFL